MPEKENTEQIRILKICFKQGFWNAALWTPNHGLYGRRKKTKKVLTQKQEFYCIPPHKDWTLALLGSLFIEEEVGPNLFHLLQMHVQSVAKNYQRKSTKSFAKLWRKIYLLLDWSTVLEPGHQQSKVPAVTRTSLKWYKSKQAVVASPDCKHSLWAPRPWNAGGITTYSPRWRGRPWSSQLWTPCTEMWLLPLWWVPSAHL